MREVSCLFFAVAFLILSLGIAYGDETPGTLKWSLDMPFYVRASPAIGSDGTIYVGSSWLYAVNPDGTVKWINNNGVGSSSPAIGADGTIYVGSDGIVALNPDGTLKWVFATKSSVNSSPAIGADGTIYIGSPEGNLYAVTPDGALKWSYTVGSPVDSSPTIGADGTIYVGSRDGKLYAILSDGTFKWAYATENSIWSAPVIGADGTVYVGSYDHKLYAIHPNGTLKWSYDTGASISTSPAIDTDGTIYVGSWRCKFYAINPEGTLKWYFRTGWFWPYCDTTTSAAIGADGTIYTGTYDGIFYAIGRDGLLKWYYDIGYFSIYSSPTIAPDGTLYMGADNYKFYAFNSSSKGLASTPSPMFHHDARHTGLSTENPGLPILSVSTSGSGRVTTTPAGISCGSVCDSGFMKGTKVHLNPIPASGNYFKEWTGACKGGGSCSVTMSGDVSVSATFETGACTYALSSKQRTLSYHGGVIALTVTGKGYPNCAPPDIAIDPEDAGWVRYTASAFKNNRGTVKISVPANDSYAPRTGTVTIGGNVFAVTQTGEPCAITLNFTSSALLPATGGTGYFTIWTTPSDCSWTAAASALWVHITSGNSGTDTGNVEYTVEPNKTKKTRSARILVTVAKKNKTYRVTQDKDRSQ